MSYYLVDRHPLLDSSLEGSTRRQLSPQRLKLVRQYSVLHRCRSGVVQTGSAGSHIWAIIVLFVVVKVRRCGWQHVSAAVSTAATARVCCCYWRATGGRVGSICHCTAATGPPR
eukprot:6855-Heterococcus_DN1.PRE.2